MSAAKNVVTVKGLTFSVPPKAVPPDFKVAITSLPASQFVAAPAEPLDEALEEARRALPPYLKPGSAIYTLSTEGALPTQAAIALHLDSNSGAKELLDPYGWDGQSWQFLPSQLNGDRKIAALTRLPKFVALFQPDLPAQVVATVLEVNDAIGETGSAITAVQVSGLTLQADGSLTGGLAGGFEFGQGYSVMPLIRAPDDNGATLNAMLASLNAQKLQIGGLVDLVNSNDYLGVVLDYRGLDPARSAAFSQFIANLATALHQQNKFLGLVAPTPTIQNAEYAAGGYDLRALGAAADMIELPLGDNLAVFGNGEADRITTWAAGEVSRYKLRLLTSTLSAEIAGDGAVIRIPGRSALLLFGNAALQTDLAAITSGSPVSVALTGKVQSLDYDPAAYTPRFTYLDESGQTRTLLYVTPETLSYQLAVAQKYNLGGVTVRDLFNSGTPAGMFDKIVQFKLKNNELTSLGAALSYTITGANGVVLQTTARPGEPFTWTAGDPGEYSIAANFVSASGIGLGRVEVVVPQATLTPTTAAATATATRRPFATATPCDGPCPTAPPAPTPAPTQVPAAAVGPIAGGGAWGAFELGGQVVHGGIPHAGEMKRAGMMWVKLQAHEGMDMAPAINNAHGQGFKILLSVVGDKSNVMNPVYQQQYGSYLATLAAQGADAIEVWNEPNIDREWPTGQVSGQNYSTLLQTVYPMIKGANQNTIVISAAPAPTGYFGGGACGNPQGCDDKPFMEALVAAGGAGYLDCIGIHYNEAIVSPREIGTDPRDNHYTRYYQTMVNTYAGAFQNARPLCFTELGILSGEGYPDLASTAPGFAWAAGNTIAEQAQWLAEAASLAKGSSAVRLMIVFNIDFTAYGSDPQAGYAIIRADGACPACDTLDGVMP